MFIVIYIDDLLIIEADMSRINKIKTRLIASSRVLDSKSVESS